MRVWVINGDEGAEDLVVGLVECGLDARLHAADGLAEALQRESNCDVLVVDLDSVDFDPLDLVRGLADGPAVIELAGFGGDALAAQRRGVADFLQKPVADEHVAAAIQRAGAERQLRREHAQLLATLAHETNTFGLVTRDPATLAQLDRLRTVKDARVSVLLEGESGTGKTMLARAIHRASSRAHKPFIEVNCGALPGELLESELFGHVKGAFTGAVSDRPGRFEAADGGTLFLDEVATASPALQIKLLRVLQDMVFERVGDTRTRRVDVRVIAATNAPLKDEVSAGRFRQDLLYRLRQAHLRLPPLRERTGDVPLLAAHTLRRLALEHGLAEKVLSPAAVSALCAHSWPGNVRELEHVLQAALFYARSTEIQAADLDSELVPSARQTGTDQQDLLRHGLFQPGVPLKQLLEVPEREILAAALTHNAGCRTKTARMLDIDRTTLFNKMRRHGLMEFGRSEG